MSWLSNGDGLLFGDYGSILSSGEFKLGSNVESCSIEIWIQPAATFDSNNIVAFSTRESPVQFAVAQSGDDLFVVRNAPDSRRRLKSSHIAIDHVFRKGTQFIHNHHLRLARNSGVSERGVGEDISRIRDYWQ